jgi:hypothetical protein
VGVRAGRYGVVVLVRWRRPIEGDGEIAKHCSEYAGVEVSVHTVRRLRQRRFDPLPAERMGRNERARWAIRNLARFADWLRREYGE